MLKYSTKVYHDVYLVRVLRGLTYVTLLKTSKDMVLNHARMSPLVYNEGKSFKAKKIIGNQPIFTIKIWHRNVFFVGKLLCILQSHCKHSYWFSWSYLRFQFIVRCSYMLMKAEDSIAPFEVTGTRQDKPLTKHSRGYLCLPTSVVSRRCPVVNSNS